MTRPKPTEEVPTLATLRLWLMDGMGEATDGCEIENDGTCVHGHPAWWSLFEAGEIEPEDDYDDVRTWDDGDDAEDEVYS